MKKPSKKFRDRLVRYNIKYRQGDFGSTSKPSIKSDNLYCPIPEHFCIKNKQSRKQILGFVDHLKRLNELSQSLFLDFSNTKVLNASAVAHLKQVLDKYESKLNKIQAKASKEPIVKAMLSKLGIHKQLGLPNFNKNHHLVDKWYFCFGNKIELNTPQYDEIENALIDNFGENSRAYEVINNAISEAITNVVHHAYDVNDEFKGWLLFFCINHKNKECQIIVSDLGKTIPKTLPPTWLEQVKNQLINFGAGKISDADLIGLATQYRKTQTKAPYRGKGFEDMRLVCDTVQGSKMRVLSGKGYFLSNQSNTEIAKKDFKKENYPEVLQGTIVSWSIPLTNM